MARFDDADADAGLESGGGACVGKLASDGPWVQTGPREESADVVGQGGQGAFAAVAHSGELDGAAADDGG
jgi:hypothetical protein